MVWYSESYTVNYYFTSHIFFFKIVASHVRKKGIIHSGGEKRPRKARKFVKSLNSYAFFLYFHKIVRDIIEKQKVFFSSKHALRDRGMRLEWPESDMIGLA